MIHAFFIKEKIMSVERKNILISRIVCGIILFLNILIPVLIIAIPTTATIIEDKGYINDYDDYLDTSYCEIVITFDKKVSNCYATINFYDESGKSLGQKSGYFYGSEKTFSNTFYVNGKVDSYEIVEDEVKCGNAGEYIAAPVLLYLSPFTLIFFIASCLLSYKTYDYNGNEIVVYAGWYHHYIKVNGTILDEHNTITSFTPIRLSCVLEDQSFVEATISLTNRIALKINGNLYKNFINKH